MAAGHAARLSASTALGRLRRHGSDANIGQWTPPPSPGPPPPTGGPASAATTTGTWGPPPLPAGARSSPSTGPPPSPSESAGPDQPHGGPAAGSRTVGRRRRRKCQPLPPRLRRGLARRGSGHARSPRNAQGGPRAAPWRSLWACVVIPSGPSLPARVTTFRRLPGLRTQTQRLQRPPLPANVHRDVGVGVGEDARGNLCGARGGVVLFG